LKGVDPGLERSISFPPQDIGEAPLVSAVKKRIIGIPFLLAPIFVKLT